MGAEMEAQRSELWSLIREVQLLACASIRHNLSALLAIGFWEVVSWVFRDNGDKGIFNWVRFGSFAAILRPFLQPTMHLPAASCIELAERRQ
jgi:hypothetical protein